MHTILNKKGVLATSMAELAAEGPVYLWRIVPRPGPRAVAMLASYMLFQAAILMGMPGKTFYGPITAGGNRPVYKVRLLARRRARGLRGRRQAKTSRASSHRAAHSAAPDAPRARQANGVQCLVATFVVYFALLQCAPAEQPAAHARPRRRALPRAWHILTCACGPCVAPFPRAAPRCWTRWRCIT